MFHPACQQLTDIYYFVKQETNNMEQNPPITTQEHNLLNHLKYHTVCFLGDLAHDCMKAG